MKKTYQIERELVIAGGKKEIFNFQLKESYAHCVGFFLTASNVGTNFSKLTLGLNIAQQEILPIDTDAVLFAKNDYLGVNDVTYDFTKENIPSRSSDVQLTIENVGSSEQKVNAYFVLTND